MGGISNSITAIETELKHLATKADVNKLIWQIPIGVIVALGAIAGIFKSLGWIA